DIQGAWNAAQAAWVRAPLTSGRGDALREDLDRLGLRGIVPDRAHATAQPPETLRAQWEHFKERRKREDRDCRYKALASFEFCPSPIATVSGTCRAAAPCMC